MILQQVGNVQIIYYATNTLEFTLYKYSLID